MAKKKSVLVQRVNELEDAVTRLFTGEPPAAKAKASKAKKRRKAKKAKKAGVKKAVKKAAKKAVKAVKKSAKKLVRKVRNVVEPARFPSLLLRLTFSL